MVDKNYLEIPIANIQPSGRNPRQGKDRGMEGLIASVKEKGILEPIIVRPLDLTQSHPRAYEIVAGERRWIAACKAGLKTIPCVVQVLSVDEAYDVMIVENLQRDDLTEMEEALSFKAYLGLHRGEKAAADLAQKISISPAYVRRRVAVLGLPPYAIEAWKKGQLLFGHLEQLLRVKDEKTRKELFNNVHGTKENPPSSVADLKESIDRMSPDLKTAFFGLDSAGYLCLSCGSNSAVQNELFAIDVDAKFKMKCLDKKCFVAKQRKFLVEKWAESTLADRFKTTGFRTVQQVGWNGFEAFRDWSRKPAAKCFKCEHFVTMLDDDFDVRSGQACLNKKCYAAIGRAKTTGEKKKVDPKAPRVSWHGEYFRDEFLTRRLPEVVKGLEPDGVKVKTLLLAMAIKENSEARDVMAKRLTGSSTYASQPELFKRLFALPYLQAKAAMLDVVCEILLQGQHVGDYSGFGTTNRFTVARFLGIDIGKEWTMTEDYLQKKTKAEILEFGKKLKIFQDKKTQDYLQKKLKGRGVDKLKKGELVDLVLKSGVELTGKVPDEILKEIK